MGKATSGWQSLLPRSSIKQPPQQPSSFLGVEIRVAHPVLLSTLAGSILLLLWLIFVPPRRLNSKNGVRVIKSRFGGLGATSFYANRYTFLSQAMTRDAAHPHHGIAKFNLLGKIVYTVGGTDVEMLRNIALCPDLSFSQGNTFLFAGIAGAKQKGLVDGEMDKEERREMKMLASAISPQRLNDMRPALVADALKQMGSWKSDNAESALVDLQKGYYPLIFRFTVRLMGMTEYATDEAALKKLMDAFWATQLNSDFFTTIVPWLPLPPLIRRVRGAITLWTMVKATLDARIKKGAREDDFAQLLIDQKQGTGSISRFVIGGLMAGILNTIGTGAYTIAFIGASPTLHEQAFTEVDTQLRALAEARGDDYDELTLQEKLERVSLEQWEAGFHTLHMCFKETIRMLLTNSLNRYYPGPQRDAKGNLRPRLVIDGHEIEDDVYVTVSPSSNLHDADAFPDPWTFDPTRYDRGQGQNEYTYLGWGAGHHRCTGMRFAKLETTIAIATVLMSYEIATTNERGEPFNLKNMPLPDLSQSHWREPVSPMRLQVRSRKLERR